MAAEFAVAVGNVPDANFVAVIVPSGI